MNKNLCSVLEDNLSYRADNMAMLWKGGSDTYRGIDAKASAVSLKRFVLEASVRVRKSGNSYRQTCLSSSMAIWVFKAGGQVVPMNVMLKPDEISWLGQDSELIFAMSQQPFRR